MESVDEMTPAELRTRLSEFGFPVMPITASTRALMAKKLKMLLSGQAKGRDPKAGGASDARRSLARYSSGEESDADPKDNGAKARARASVARRSTPPAVNDEAMPPPPPRRPPSRAEEPPVHQAPVEKVETVTTKRVIRTYRPADDDRDYDTGSDSDLEAPPVAPPPFVGRRSAAESTPLPAPLGAVSRASEDLNAIRARLGLSRPASGTTRDEYDSPYLSSFSRKLSALKDGNGNGNGNGHGSERPRTVPPPRAPYSTSTSKSASPDAKNNLVSLGIVGAGIVFFVALSFAYVGMKNDAPFDPDDPSSVIPLCTSNSRAGVDCVEKSKASRAIDLLKMLHPELQARAADEACSVPGRRAYALEEDVERLVKAAYPERSSAEIAEDLRNAQVLAVHNPSWGIAVMKLQPEGASQPSTVLKSMDYVAPLRGTRRLGLIASEPSVPVRCLLYDKMYAVGIAAAGLVSITVMVYVVKEAVKAYRSFRRRREDEVYALVERVVEFLSAENGEAGAVPVNHVRDALIPPQSRDRTARIWNAAVKYLEENESRVRFEMDSVGGEEYRAIRWVSPHGSPRTLRGGAKAWQGQAFETQRGSVNNLGFSPTPCLKIRHMIDKNDKNPNLRTVVRDAILEKCGPDCKILHVEIDRASCCVFVKCASSADAGIVYRSLHGWWYEGSLITVKFLRLERYMDHFPLSPSDGPYLKPSGQ